MGSEPLSLEYPTQDAGVEPESVRGGFPGVTVGKGEVQVKLTSSSLHTNVTACVMREEISERGVVTFGEAEGKLSKRLRALDTAPPPISLTRESSSLHRECTYKGGLAR